MLTLGFSAMRLKETDTSKLDRQSNLAKNLTLLLERNGISESELARELNIPYNSIRRLISGFTSDPRMSTLKLIASYFNISLDALVGDQDPDNYSPTENRAPVSIPILSWTDISEPDFLTKIFFNDWPKWQPVALAATDDLSKRAYAIESRKSMQPRFPLGTVLVIDPDKDPIDGDLVLVRIKENNAVSLRDLAIDPPILHLFPIIENSPSMIYDTNEHEIIGIVVLTLAFPRKESS